MTTLNPEDLVPDDEPRGPHHLDCYAPGDDHVSCLLGSGAMVPRLRAYDMTLLNATLPRAREAARYKELLRQALPHLEEVHDEGPSFPDGWQSDALRGLRQEIEAVLA